MKQTTQNQDAQYKTCASCRKSKLLSDQNFYPDKQTKDNFSAYCKACKAEKQLMTRYRTEKAQKGIESFNERINLTEHHLRLMKKIRDE